MRLLDLLTYYETLKCDAHMNGHMLAPTDVKSGYTYLEFEKKVVFKINTPF